jgi:hypothetical protein
LGEGDNNQVRSFSAFAPAVLAGIGHLQGTPHDRSIQIRLVRAKPGEVKRRFDSRRIARERDLNRQLARWARDHFSQIEACDPVLPPDCFNRLADNWRPLMPIAEIVGGDWPARARAAFAQLTANADLEAQGRGALLLGDLRDLFVTEATDRLGSGAAV